MVDIAYVLSKSWRGKQWSMQGDEYEGLEWLEPSGKPTLAEIEAAGLALKNRTEAQRVEQDEDLDFSNRIHASVLKASIQVLMKQINLLRQQAGLPAMSRQDFRNDVRDERVKMEAE